MVGTADSIRKAMNSIEASTEEIAEELQARYQDYLMFLGKAVKRQLILTSFQLCTQAYPEAFLRLTVSQREQLQQKLKALGSTGEEQLLKLLEASEDWQTAPEELPPGLIAALEQLPGAKEKDASDIANAPPEQTLDAEDSSSLELGTSQQSLAGSEHDSELGDVQPELAEEPDSAQSIEEPMMKAMLMNAVIEALGANRVAEGDGLTPLRLARRYMAIERQLRSVLQDLSKAANALLQEAKVLPNLPDAILSAATEAELPNDKAGSPNMLNVLIEMGEVRSQDEDDEDEDDDEDDVPSSDQDVDQDEDDMPRAMAHLVALNLRLADIEFTDTRLSMHRSRLRQSLEKLKRLAGKYQKKQRELSIAEAEAAWRSVWYDGESPEAETR